VEQVIYIWHGTFLGEYRLIARGELELVFKSSATGTGREWYDENKELIMAVYYPGIKQ
jgi:hypothetical protein